ncbi:MAG: hypothetical protein ACJ72W_27875 [Actinoallomurus sp.]
MIRHKMIGVAVAATIVGGFGAYEAASAFAETTAPATSPSAPTPSPSASSTGHDAMIRHCTEHMPAGERAKARQEMQHMMSGGSMMGDASGASSHPMG